MASKSSSEHVPTEDDSAEAYKLFANVIERMSGDPEQNKQLLSQLISAALFVLANGYVKKQQEVLRKFTAKQKGRPQIIDVQLIARYIKQVDEMRDTGAATNTKNALRNIRMMELKLPQNSMRKETEIARWVKKMENQISAHRSRIKKFKPSKLQAAVLDTPENPENPE